MPPGVSLTHKPVNPFTFWILQSKSGLNFPKIHPTSNPPRRTSIESNHKPFDSTNNSVATTSDSYWSICIIGSHFWSNYFNYIKRRFIKTNLYPCLIVGKASVIALLLNNQNSDNFYTLTINPKKIKSSKVV